MSGKERGLIRMIIRDFINSITPTFVRRKLVGEDFYGTKYYEVPLNSTTRRARPTRYFQSVNDDFEQDIPAEWEAWLRHRRKEPPTSEEVETNYKLAVTRKLKGDEIAAKYETAKKESSALVEKSGYRSFPVYEEYSTSVQNNTQKFKPKS